MGAIDIDVADLQDPFAPAPEDRYTVEITEYSDDDSKAGDPMHFFNLKIVGDTEEAGKNIRCYHSMSEKAKKYSEWAIRCYAVAGGLDLKKVFADPSILVGATFDVQLDVQPGEGEYGPSNSVSTIYGAE